MDRRDNKKKVRLNLMDKELAQSLGRELLIKMEKNPGITLKEATGVSDDALEEIYSLAFTFYNQGKYSEALSLFQFLAGADPSMYKYLLGLASTFHQLGSYEEAAHGFYIALRLEPDNPIPAYYIMDCFLKQNLLEEAEEFAGITSLLCENNPDYAELKQRCDLIGQSLKNKK